jgi:hypothetical protein
MSKTLPNIQKLENIKQPWVLLEEHRKKFLVIDLKTIYEF